MTATSPRPDSRVEHPSEHRIVVPPHVPMVALLGSHDSVLRAVEDGFPHVDVHARGNEITVAGPAGDVALVSRLLDELVEVVEAGTELTPDVVRRSVGMLTAETAQRPAEVLTLNILSNRGRTIRPKTVGQKRYVEAIDVNTITFGIGPAGTGKTYLAMAKAVQALQSHQVNRIILTRPAVEAGERLGYLPGSLTEKIDPYLRPLYDALHDMVDPDSIPKLIEAGTIEVAPLAFMRGRSLNDSFIILDEAQNTTSEQMKMFLTRLGFGSKMVITGDATQVDLPGGTASGLRVVQDILTGVDDVEFCRLTSSDVVRHRLVSDIIDAYARWDTVAARGRSDRPERPRRAPARRAVAGGRGAGRGTEPRGDEGGEGRDAAVGDR
jgi:phosphate starvation-inducible PhoH-like protein